MCRRCPLNSGESRQPLPPCRHPARDFRSCAGLGKDILNRRRSYRYIKRVVLNTTIDHYRASKRAVDCFSTETIFVYSEPRSSQPNTLKTLLKNEFTTSKFELLEKVARALTDLPPDQRKAIHLILGTRPGKLKEMCREIGVPYSILRSRMIAGLERIRTKIKTKGLYRPYLDLTQIGSHRHGN